MYSDAGLSLEKVRIIPNFVDGDEFMPDSRPGKDWIYLGRLTKEKGIEALIQHWPDDKTLRVFGDGPLISIAADQAKPNIIFEGRVSRGEIPAILADSQGLVFPSLCAEGAVPLTYVEALAAGRPVVAFSGNGAADDIDQSGSGETFSQWPDLAVALNKVESRHQVYTNRAYDHYRETFTNERWVGGISSLYSDVLDRR
ncbi:hypothetical protein GCM10023346_17180 [Arthrobacter gyeryongensis]|uniref:Glycosyl transferase family 1 domain-containing protein n=2 Tax=Arthrobacter gyeryongensis TaxID=1650592 RepID=A0ABP9SBN8_9MICC